MEATVSCLLMLQFKAKDSGMKKKKIIPLGNILGDV